MTQDDFRPRGQRLLGHRTHETHSVSQDPRVYPHVLGPTDQSPCLRTHGPILCLRTHRPNQRHRTHETHPRVMEPTGPSPRHRTPRPIQVTGPTSTSSRPRTHGPIPTSQDLQTHPHHTGPRHIPTPQDPQVHPHVTGATGASHVAGPMDPSRVAGPTKHVPVLHYRRDLQGRRHRVSYSILNLLDTDPGWKIDCDVRNKEPTFSVPTERGSNLFRIKTIIGETSRYTCEI